MCEFFVCYVLIVKHRLQCYGDFYVIIISYSVNVFYNLAKRKILVKIKCQHTSPSIEVLVSISGVDPIFFLTNYNINEKPPKTCVLEPGLVLIYRS